MYSLKGINLFGFCLLQCKRQYLTKLDKNGSSTIIGLELYKSKRSLFYILQLHKKLLVNSVYNHLN